MINLHKSSNSTPKAIISVLIGILFVLTSCESPILPEEQETSSEHLITLHVNGFRFIPFPDSISMPSTSRASTAGVTHLDLAVFSPEGEKILKVNQNTNDTSFGSPEIKLSEGTYTLVIIAHSGTGVATITSPTEVTFPNNKVTDTFYTHQQFTVSSSTSSLDVTLQRAVAMVRVIATDANPPADFTQLKLYYTGGSSTFNPQTGYGSKDSRQTEIRQVAEAQKDNAGNTLYEIYTFPHTQEDIIKLTLTPQDASGNQMAVETTIAEVPVRLNYITEARGRLFAINSTSFTATLSLNINDQWGGTTSVEF